MKNYSTQIIYLLTFFFISIGLQAKTYQVASPDGKIIINISTENEISWSASINGQAVFNQNKMSLTLNNEVLGENVKVRKSKQSSFSGQEEVVVPIKSKVIENNYNQLSIDFKNDFAVTFRVFNNGIAYRFESSKKGIVKVDDEQMELNFANDYPILFPEEKTLLSHYERLYLDEKLSTFEKGRFCSLPTLVKAQNNIKIGIMEADLYDYPCLFLEATGNPVLKSKFPNMILESEPKGDRNITILKEADYIAETEGTRTFPWRVFMVSEEDKNLVENQMVYLLSRECKLDITSWIMPGLVAWDWWNNNNLYGVHFKSGIDNQTYKYYIDFASKYGIPYIILDEGWSKTTTNVLESRSEIDIPELAAYGKEKGVYLILWSLWGPLDKDMNRILDQFKAWEVKGLKVDFMAQAGQNMVNFYERTAKACADRQLLVNFHGAYKPSGLRKAYPNVVNYEGVKGMENCKWSDVITPEHDVTLPFTRMLAGPLDYTPGAMVNETLKGFRVDSERPMSLGTRCHQAGMYVVYEAPLQMLCGNASNYMREPEFTRFIAQIPTTWDQTVAVEVEKGEYLVVARKNEGKWYIGGLTNWTARDLEVDLGFLGRGKWEIEYVADGINADRYASDYILKKEKLTGGNKLKITMAPGGGYAAVLRKL